MEFNDCREWISKADGMGELKTLTGCDWDLEIGAITEMVMRKEDSPAVLFDEIKGHPKGYRVLVNSLSSRKRIGMTQKKRNTARGMRNVHMVITSSDNSKIT